MPIASCQSLCGWSKSEIFGMASCQINLYSTIWSCSVFVIVRLQFPVWGIQNMVILFGLRACVARSKSPFKKLIDEVCNDPIWYGYARGHPKTLIKATLCEAAHVLSLNQFYYVLKPWHVKVGLRLDLTGLNFPDEYERHFFKCTFVSVWIEDNTSCPSCGWYALYPSVYCQNVYW